MVGLDIHSFIHGARRESRETRECLGRGHGFRVRGHGARNALTKVTVPGPRCPGYDGSRHGQESRECPGLGHVLLANQRRDLCTS
ncbi:unnamed protein product [Boreogadus saida]